jgi:hypothetical protein
MKYSDKYIFEGLLDFQTRGIQWGRDHSGLCTVCGDVTNWMDIDFQCWLCSTECSFILDFQYQYDTWMGNIRGIIEWIRIAIEKGDTPTQLIDDLESALDEGEVIKDWMEKYPLVSPGASNA